MSSAIPPTVARLFWDIEVAQLDLLRHADYVMGRVMTRGGWEAMKWLRGTFSAEVIAEYLTRRGDRLPPRDRAYWSVVSGIPAAVPRGGGRPPWAGR